jgi:small conductance mechanosensitive channel
MPSVAPPSPQVAPTQDLVQTADTLAEAVIDTTAVTDTTAAADTAAIDTTDALSDFSREMSRTGELLATGEWEQVATQLYAGLGRLIVDFIPKVLGAIFVFILFYAVYRAAGSLLGRVLNRSKRVDVGLENLLKKTYRVVMLIFIGVMVLDQFGVNVTALLAGLSIVGIAVGFAARDTLENFISGVTILLDRPFRVGDNIVIEDTFGTVEEITLRSTRLRTPHNEMVVLPNLHMINQRLVNHTMLSTLRVEIPFGIAYKEYPQEAREVVLKLTEDDDRIHPEHPPQVVVKGLGDSSVDMALRLYLRNPKLEIPVRFEYIEKVREALRAADIEIPFPHLQLFVDEAKAFDDTFLMRPDWPSRTSDGDPPTA